MKKNRLGKLALHRETLLHLDALRWAVGRDPQSVDCEEVCEPSAGGGCTVPPTTCLATCSCPSASCQTRAC